MNRPFAGAKRGYRIIDGKRIYFDSMSEANYYRYLVFLKEMKLIKDFEYHPPYFDFSQWIKHGTNRYELDFLITENNGDKKYVEIKSTDDIEKMDQKSRTKIKRFLKYYPELKLDLVSTKRVRNLNKLGIIHGWEGAT